MFDACRNILCDENLKKFLNFVGPCLFAKILF